MSIKWSFSCPTIRYVGPLVANRNSIRSETLRDFPSLCPTFNSSRLGPYEVLRQTRLCLSTSLLYLSCGIFMGHNLWMLHCRVVRLLLGPLVSRSQSAEGVVRGTRVLQGERPGSRSNKNAMSRSRLQFSTLLPSASLVLRLFLRSLLKPSLSLPLPTSSSNFPLHLQARS
jgi:hypothetical protein